jgi:hypothetical protein
MDPTLSRQSVQRLRGICQPYEPAALYSPETFFSNVSGTHQHIFYYKYLLESNVDVE